MSHPTRDGSTPSFTGGLVGSQTKEEELTASLLSQAMRDRVAEYTVGMLKGITAPSSVLVVASAGSGVAPSVAHAWHKVFEQEDLKERLHDLIEEAGTKAAENLGKRILPREQLASVLAGDAQTPVADDQFGLLVNHWRGTDGAFGQLRSFEITLAALSKAELENHRQFTQEAKAVGSRLAHKRAGDALSSEVTVSVPKI